MPRYMVERTFTDGLEIPTNEDGARAMQGVVQNNAKEQVTWVQSFVSSDKTRTFCVYDGPTPEAIRRPRASARSPSTRSPKFGCSIRTSTSAVPDDKAIILTLSVSFVAASHLSTAGRNDAAPRGPRML